MSETVAIPEALTSRVPQLSAGPATVRAPRYIRPAFVSNALTDPFIHFLLLGALILFAARLFPAQPPAASINVNPQQLAHTYAQQYGREPTPTELRTLLDRYVQDEIYFREGTALGLQLDDEIVRRRVVQKYEFLQQDNAIIEEPGEAALQSYFNVHQAQYATRERVSFTHVYFQSRQGDDSQALARAEQVKDGLRNSNLPRAPQAGDAFPELYDYSQLGSDELTRLFGRYPIVADILRSPLNQWAGPFRSGYGWHLIRITQRQPAQIPPFAEVREQVRDDFVTAERQRRASEILAELRKKYVIDVSTQP